MEVNFFSREKEKATYHLKQPNKGLERISLASPENEKEKNEGKRCLEGKKIKEEEEGERERFALSRFYFS
jgi:hypothetical protein